MPSFVNLHLCGLTVTNPCTLLPLTWYDHIFAHSHTLTAEECAFECFRQASVGVMVNFSYSLATRSCCCVRSCMYSCMSVYGSPQMCVNEHECASACECVFLNCMCAFSFSCVCDLNSSFICVSRQRTCVFVCTLSCMQV